MTIATSGPDENVAQRSSSLLLVDFLLYISLFESQEKSRVELFFLGSRYRQHEGVSVECRV